MRTALYFPHTEVRSKNTVHSSLLLWDNLEFIVPFRNYRPNYDDREMAEAMDIIGLKRVPSEQEKTILHSLVDDLLKSGVPETFRYSPKSGKCEQKYEVWSQKLAQETWNLLVEHDLTSHHLSNCDYPMSQAAGLSLMAILADVLAGETRARVTDRSLAYATIANAPSVTSDVVDPVRVVPLTFNGIAVDRIPFDRLIDFRVREAKDSGYRTLRHNYLEAIEKHLKAIAAVAPNSPDRRELDRTFQSDMEDDLADLKRELGFSKREAWLSKEVIGLFLATGGLMAAGVGIPEIPMPEVVTGSGAMAFVGGLLGTQNKYAKSRYDTLRKHPMAYLYELAD
jgi:hypothetical protein